MHPPHPPPAGGGEGGGVKNFRKVFAVGTGDQKLLFCSGEGGGRVVLK